MKAMLIALFNMLGFYNSAQSQAALKQLIEASGGDVHDVAKGANSMVLSKRNTAGENKRQAELDLEAAIKAYTEAKHAADELDADGDRLYGEAELIEKAAKLMGLELTPDASNNELSKV